MRELFIRYLPYFKGYKLQFTYVFFGIIATAAATAATALIMQYLVDDVFIKHDKQMLVVVPLVLIALYTIKGAGRFIQSYFTNYIGQDIIRELRDTLLEHMLHLDMAFFNDAKSGELISRINNDIERIRVVVSNMIPEYLRDSLTVIFLISVAVAKSPLLAFYALVVLPLVFYPLSKLAKRMKKISHRSQEKNSDVIERLSETFNNVEVIKANATEAYEKERFASQNREFFRINMKGVFINELVSPIMEIVGAIGLALVVTIGAEQIIEGKMSVGEVVAFVTAIGMLYDPIRRIASMYNKMQDGIAATERIDQVLSKHPTIKSGKDNLSQPITNIELSSVSLHYGDIKALENINLSANSGETIALVGNSGGGKSSLVNLLIRFYDTTNGEVRVNNKSIKNFSLRSLREQIAYVTQRVYIFQDSLAMNVAYGHEVDERRVIKALKRADAYGFTMELKDGIHTQLDEFGANLSGGQRQRIALARAIYKNASLYLFDEATSALDNKSERRIQNSLEELSKDKITFIIAHRLSTVEHADKILLFERGRIVALGTHLELIKTSPEYQKLSGTLME